MSELTRLALVTGAGASAPLGRDGNPVPTMKLWANLIIDNAADQARAIGLHRQIETFEFETRLGTFLAAASAVSVLQEKSLTQEFFSRYRTQLSQLKLDCDRLTSTIARTAASSFGATATDPN
jgi:hypothetical protein